MIGFIYIITNKINGKVYIGQTTQQPSKRFGCHFSRKSSPVSVMNRVINKYGGDNFDKNILEKIEAKTKKELIYLLTEKELFYIKYYNSANRLFGYNLKSKADEQDIKEQLFNIKSKHAIESKNKMSLNKKRLFTEQKRLNYRNSKLGNKNSMYGKSGKNSPVSRSVIQLDKNNNFLKEYFSATEASKLTGISQKNISTCCTGKLKSAGGFIWKHKT